MPGGEIRVDDPRAPDARALLALHLTFARAQTPPEDAHAIDVDGLLDPAVTFFGYRANGTPIATGEQGPGEQGPLAICSRSGR